MSNQTDADVIVIGAGPSGSYAAKLLHDQGVRVKLVEAKDRVGGRTWSTKSDAPGGPIDFGGQWIKAKNQDFELSIHKNHRRT